jgi:uncharacterized protein (UPF0333 family)
MEILNLSEISKMQKKSQITIFLVLGVVLIIIVGFIFYFNKSSAKSQSVVSVTQSLDSSDTEIVKTYAESCIKNTAEEALFEKIGLQGGFIDTNNAPQSTSYLGNDVPYLVDVNNIYILSLGTIRDRLSNYVEVEFINCFKEDVFEDIGINISRDTGTTNAEVSFNENDVSITLLHPVIIRKDKSETKIDSFRVSLPIRLRALYESAVVLLDNIKNTQPDVYDISSDCNDYDKNGLTNVYFKNNEIIQLVDFSTYEEYYFNSFIFQFAVKDVNVDGNCVG